MDANTMLISNFYRAFQQLDAAGMNACYSQQVVFSDPVFGFLDADEVKAMWQMLCKNAKDFKLEYGNIQALDEEYYTCEWTASYTFSRTGRPVVNKVKAFMRLKDEKITEHSDGFSLHKWAAQALGVSGWLIGWNRWYQQKIKNNARRQLLHYIDGQ